MPEQFGYTARIKDIPRARFWGDQLPPFFNEIIGQPREKLMEKFPEIFGKEYHYLALSGGGANGAFGAVMMVGWSAAGTRPTFTLVTGISTGALMSTFVFLGPAYDQQLKEMYTTYSTKDLVIWQKTDIPGKRPLPDLNRLVPGRASAASFLLVLCAL